MLVDSPQSSEFYYRNTTQAPVVYPQRDILVPKSNEQAYLQFCGDQLCRLVVENKLGKLLQELDPHNTYMRESEKVEDKVTNIMGLPEGVTLNLMEPTGVYEWVRNEVKFVYDGVTTVTYGAGKTVEWGALGTAPMHVNGMVLTLNGVAPGAPFTSVVSLIRKPSRDLLKLLTAADATSPKWDPRLAPYKDSTIPSTRLVAYVLNALANI